MDEKISEANFTIYAAKLYESPILDTSEFYEDLKRFSYIKRLLNQYEKTGILKQNLIINHIIILYNLFGSKATEMLFLRLEGQESLLKTFLIFLQRMPDRISGIGIKCRQINNEDIPIDIELLKRLETL